MTQEQKELLLKDLCGRLPYGVKISKVVEDYISESKKPKSINTDGCIVIENEPFDNGTPDLDYWYICEVKPYLRPMSSMTEEEITEIYEFAKPYIIEEIKHGAESDNPDRKVEIENGFLSNAVIIDELNKRHIDYRGLIPMGLALEAPEDMYNLN